MKFKPKSLPIASALIVVILACVAVGAIPDSGNGAESAANPPSETAIPDPVFAKLFADGVAFMQQGRIHEAIITFEAAQKRQPNVPEAAVNLGFLHLSRKDYPRSRALFEQTIRNHPSQTNAYWGVAMAAEGMGDTEFALDAIRTFMHLEPESSPFHRKALAAAWEWEEQIKAKKEGKPFKIPAGAVSLPDKRRVTTPEEIRKDYVAPSEGPR